MLNFKILIQSNKPGAEKMLENYPTFLKVLIFDKYIFLFEVAKIIKKILKSKHEKVKTKRTGWIFLKVTMNRTQCQTG